MKLLWLLLKVQIPVKLCSAVVSAHSVYLT